MEKRSGVAPGLLVTVIAALSLVVILTVRNGPPVRPAALPPPIYQAPARPLRREIDITPFGSRVVRIGDLNGDGEVDFLFAQCALHLNSDGSTFKPITCLTAIDANGKVLWQQGRPDGRMTDAVGDLPVQLDDLDGDGELEVLCVMGGGIRPAPKRPLRRSRGTERMAYFGGELRVLDAATGDVVRRTPLTNVNARDAILTCELDGDTSTREIIVKDRHSALVAYDSYLNRLWSFNWTSVMAMEEDVGDSGATRDVMTPVGNLAHYPVPVRGENGRDRIVIGPAVIDHVGNVLFSLIDRRMPILLDPRRRIWGSDGHTDAIVRTRLDPSETRGADIVLATTLTDAHERIGKTNHYLMVLRHYGQVQWKRKLVHVQQVMVGDFRPDVEGLEIWAVERMKRVHAMGGMTGYDDPAGAFRLHLYDRRGNELTVRKESGDAWEWLGRAAQYRGEGGADRLIAYRRGVGKPPIGIDGHGRPIEEFELGPLTRRLQERVRREQAERPKDADEGTYSQIWCFAIDTAPGERSPIGLVLATPFGGALNLYYDGPTLTAPHGFMRNMTHYRGDNSH